MIADQKKTLFAAAALMTVAVALSAAYFVWPTVGRVTETRPPERPEAGHAELRAALERQVAALLERTVVLRFDGKDTKTQWEKLGMVADPEAIDRQVRSLAHRGVRADIVGIQDGKESVPVMLEHDKAFEALVDFKDRVDRQPRDARLDLDKRDVVAEEAGYGVDVYASLALLEEAARARRDQVDLVGGALPPRVTRAQMGNPDISKVLGYWETHYPPGEKDRNYNLKLVAEKLNGAILLPAQLFSFNAIVGDRTEKEGYRVAHVIQAGEMVDGLAGGACQISSTLHGAAWFAGLEIVYSTPHSRPSAYITMGLDATVVYPTTDLKLRNPYDFPVVIRYLVSQGLVRVEILGKGRPWDRIAFEREVKKEVPYETITREDDTMPVGSSLIEQIGFPGYELERRRIFMKGGKKAKTEKWQVRYPPTTEYVRMGSNPNPNLKAPVQDKLHGPMPPGDPLFHLEQ